MDYPEDRKELAYLLKTTGTLYSFDQYTQLNAEAALCGAHVKIVTETGFVSMLPNSVDPQTIHGLPRNFEPELRNFIEIT
jgi:hypothetical protein